MPKFPQNRAGPLNLLLHQPCTLMYDEEGSEDAVYVFCILTKAGGLSIRSPPRGNNHHYSEGVSIYSPPLNRKKDAPYVWRPFKS